MIRLARSERVTGLMQRHGGATALARRFVVVGGPEAAAAAARRLRDRRGISASLSYLGEYVSDPVLIDRTVEASLAVSQLLGAAGLDVQVSVDPTAIGQLASPDLCRASAERIVCRAPGRRASSQCAPAGSLAGQAQTDGKCDSTQVTC
jgi:proline dehydrogenase